MDPAFILNPTMHSLLMGDARFGIGSMPSVLLALKTGFSTPMGFALPLMIFARLLTLMAFAPAALEVTTFSTDPASFPILKLFPMLAARFGIGLPTAAKSAHILGTL